MNLAIQNNVSSDYKPVPLAELFNGTDCQFLGSADDVIITGLANDSRRVKVGDLFFAVPGFAADGTKYIPEAASLGARAVVVETDVMGFEHLPIIKSGNIRKAMSSVAARFFGYPSKSLIVVGVTGTNGKTTITYLLSHILKSFDNFWGKIGTVEYYTGKRRLQAVNTTPDTLEIQKYLAEMREAKLTGCVMEVSSHGLDQHRCDDIEFSAAIFTNLTQDHLDYHKDLDSYFKAKSILFTKLLKSDGVAVVNANDPYSERLQKLTSARVITYSAIFNSSQTRSADIVFEDHGYNQNRRYFKASFSGKQISGTMPYLGKFNLANAAASVTAVVGLGHDFQQAVEALATAPQVPGRVERIDRKQPFTIIIDYAHTPDALENLLTGIDTRGRKIVVFGCGGDRDTTKRPIMAQVVVKYADMTVVTSDNPRTEDAKKIINDILKGIPPNSKYTVIEKRDEAIGEALKMAKPDDLVIIAGKGHEDYQIIGNTRHYFSDSKVVETYLKKMGYANS